MNGFTLLVLAIGVSMDAFSVSVCKGLAAGRVSLGNMLTAGLWFGAFQALMPTVGYLIGDRFGVYIERIDHWIAFCLLSFLGGKMIAEALRREEAPASASFSPKEMLLMAVATSIDALAVGVSLAILPSVNISFAVSMIGLCTFAFSFLGVKLGSLFGAAYRHGASLVGGVILFLVGLGILLEHLL